MYYDSNKQTNKKQTSNSLSINENCNIEFIFKTFMKVLILQINVINWHVQII